MNEKRYSVHINLMLSLLKDQKKIEPWALPIKTQAQLDTVEIETVRFFFAQAEKLLENLLEITDSFQTRAVYMITVIIPALVIVAGYIGTHLEETVNIIALSVAATCLVLSLFNCLKIINIHTSLRAGSAPDKLIDLVWLEKSGAAQTKAIILNECRDYQSRINRRINDNIQLGKNLKWALRFLIYMPFVTAEVFILSKLLTDLP